MRKSRTEQLVETLVACLDLEELEGSEVGRAAAGAQTSNAPLWMAWMVHRVHLNDPSLKVLDFTGRNMPSASKAPYIAPKLAAAVEHNTVLEKLLLGRSGFLEAEILSVSLEKNVALKVLNVEKNFESLDLVRILNAIAQNQTLCELSCEPRKALGAKHGEPVWQAAARAVKSNQSLRKIRMDIADNTFRILVDEQLRRNTNASWRRRSEGQASPTSLAQPEAVSSGQPEPLLPEKCPESLYVAASSLPVARAFRREDFSAQAGLVEILPGRCWVVPDVLTEQECHVWIQSGMNHGMAKNTTFTSELRTNRRTAGFVNLDMARTVRERLPAELLRQVEGCSPGTRVQGVYEEWRVTQYEPGELFRPHYDDSVFRGRADNGAVGETSSHTVLAVLSQDFRGGATRFWPSGRYEEPVDVLAPQGSVLIFEQRTLLHEGCAIESGVKFVAQTGLMRAPCSGAVEQAPQPVLFRWGPGFKAF